MGDLNGDGALDLALAHSSSNHISIVLGDGTGSFAPPQSFFVGTHPYSIAMGDVNGDGALDLAVSNLSSSNVSILLGDGNGAFSPRVNYLTEMYPFSVAMGDLNGDGALDLVVANQGVSPNFVGSVSVLLGDGAGSFAPQQIFVAGNQAHIVAIGDFNSDSFLDLVVGNYGDNNVSVLINLTTPPPPGAFDLLSPGDDSAGLSAPDVMLPWPGGSASELVRWSDAAGSDSYTLTIALDPGLTTIVLHHTGLVVPAFGMPVGVLQPGTRYYWGVTAVNAIGSTPSTTPSFTFTTAAPADLNGDGVVNAADLAALLANWGMLP